MVCRQSTPRDLPRQVFVKDECFHRGFDILQVHKRFSIRKRPVALPIHYGFCIRDVCCLPGEAKRSGTSPSCKISFRQQSGDQVPWCDRPIWRGPVSCGQSLSQRPENKSTISSPGSSGQRKHFAASGWLHARKICWYRAIYDNRTNSSLSALLCEPLERPPA